MSNISVIAYLVISLALGYALVYPSYKDLNSLLGEKRKQVASLEMMDNIENRKSELLAEFNKIPDEEKKNIDTVLPSSFDFVKLVSHIDAAAAKHGISIDKITSTNTDPSVGDSIQSAEPAKPYESAVIGFSFTASYDKFLVFLADMEKSMRIIDIRSAKLETQEDGLYQFNTEFETYWLR